MRGDGRQREQQNISLRPVDRAALRVLMEDEGSVQLSPIVRQLIKAEMTRRYGPQWEATVWARQANDHGHGNGNGKATR